MKIYKVNDNAAIRFKCDIASPAEQWHPSRDQWDTFYLLEEIQGKEFKAFDEGVIIGGIKDMTYLHIGKQDKCRSEVLAINPIYLTDTKREVVDQPPPIEETTGGWWKEKGLEVVRLRVQGFTDGFMAFVSHKTLYPWVKYSELSPEKQDENKEKVQSMQTYEEYLAMKKAYNFTSMKLDEWKKSQTNQHGFYKD